MHGPILYVEDMITSNEKFIRSDDRQSRNGYIMKEFIRKINAGDAQKPFAVHEVGELVYLSSPLLDQTEGFTHGFSTRLGGVSTGETWSMNLSYPREESAANVLENYTRLAAAIGVDRDRIVCSAQTHTTNVLVVREEDAGCGVIRERPWKDIDALVTNVPGITLCVFTADCVPLLIADPVHKAVGAAHSGWRGTIGDIAEKTLSAMHQEYGTRPEDVSCAIGPSICGDCYEVGEEVAEQFWDKYGGDADSCPVLRPKTNGKYLLNLWESCRINFLRAGVKSENISVTDICTHCNPEQLFSHRTQHGKQGNLGALICLNA